MLVIVADRWDANLGGREQYADDLVAYLSGEGRQVTRAVTGRVPPDVSTRVLALSPIRQATHYQLHTGLLANAFAAESESLESPLRRTLFWPTLRFNGRRRRLLAEEAHVLSGSAAIMTFSEAAARALVQHGVSRSRVRLSRPGVDLQRFRPPAHGAGPAPGETLRLAFVAHNFALKGLRAAILALARSRRLGVDASLIVAGRGAARSYRRLAVIAGVAEHVRFTGPVSQDAVADLYRSSHALIHPTFYDPFPRVIVEALACGCPVITTARCGAAEILTPGRDGLAIDDPRDVVRLAEAIVTIGDPPMRTRMRAAAAELGRTFDAATHFRAVSEWLFGEGGIS